MNIKLQRHAKTGDTEVSDAPDKCPTIARFAARLLAAHPEHG